MNAHHTTRQSGKAMLLVVFFTATALPLSLATLEIAGKTQTSELKHHEVKAAHQVMKAGLVTAVNEYSRNLDVEGDGVGFMGIGGDATGVPVRDGEGKILGHYRVTLVELEERTIFTVVAAVPGFEDLGDPEADNQRYLVANKVAATPGLPLTIFDHQAPLAIIGPMPADVADAVLASNQIEISDPTHSVPAVTITDDDYWSSFVAVVDESKATVEGADPLSPGSAATGGSAVANSSGSELSEAALDLTVAAMESYLMDQVASASLLSVHLDLDDDDDNGNGNGGGSEKTTTLAEGVYYVAQDLDLSNYHLTGSGVLIVGRSFHLGNGARLEWDGIIVVASDGYGDALLDIDNGARLDVTGNVFVHTASGSSELQCQSGSRVTVSGALVGFASSDGPSVDLQSGSEVSVVGLMALLGDGVVLDAGNGSDLDISGSLTIAVPEGNQDGLETLDLEQGSKTLITWNQEAYEAAMEELGLAFDEFQVPAQARGAWQIDSYYQPPAWQTVYEQEAAIDSLSSQ